MAVGKVLGAATLPCLSQNDNQHEFQLFQLDAAFDLSRFGFSSGLGDRFSPASEKLDGSSRSPGIRFFGKSNASESQKKWVPRN